MKCKIFHARSVVALEDAINKWLETHPVSPDSMRFEFSTVYGEDEVEHILFHTLVLFYVPMMRVG